MKHPDGCKAMVSGSLPYLASSSLTLFSAAEPGRKLPVIALGPRSRSSLEKVIVRLAWSYQTSISNLRPLWVGVAMQPDGNGGVSPQAIGNFPPATAGGRMAACGTRPPPGEL